MMSVTHAAIAACTTSLAIGTANPLVLGVAAIASQLPDIDTTKSFTGRAFYPLAAWLETKYAHRSVSHSFMASGIIAIATAPMLVFLNWQWWAAINLGFFMGWFADTFTKAGVGAFYPSTKRLVIPGNPNNRIRAGSSAEFWILAIATTILIISCNLISNGGVTENFARSFFRDAGTASEMFKRYGSTQQVFIKVKGNHVITNQAVDEEFKVISSGGLNSVIAEDSKRRLYQIGNDPSSQIKPVSVETRLGDPVAIASKEVELENILGVDWLNQLQNNAYVTGSLIVDDLNEAKAPLLVERYAPISIFGGQIKLVNARKSDLLPVLGDQFISQGRVIVKVRSDE
ncbi:putative membrane-bound metal-dependent hydrolase [Synechococcus sp. PCC 7502]|uniref:metal-dependent hydrolase n=1 Tax=Synechococcus sp. PCC 7502 TaxID=1173263 RepID=UPI00029FD101|nr:metal-dependent hydrolase [Synechococcus sp. PCC 7502]AFY74801.1 putative membrane-bound metal-dependent hydrolase [Synechococcus sp. PCC 7502]